MENTLKRIDIYVIAIALVVAGYFIWNATQGLGFAPSGLEASIGTSSTATVGTSTVVTLTATSTNCAARIISTGTRAIRLSFDWKLASTSLGETLGHYQAGSTTVAYDSGLYGCSVVTARGVTEGINANDSSSTITTSVSY